MEPFTTPLAGPADARATIAAELSRYYSELARQTAPAFSVARLIRTMAEGREIDGREGEVVRAAATVAGLAYDPHRVQVPLIAMRAMSTTPGSKGGFFVGSESVDPVDVLRGYSVVASAGMSVIPGLQNQATVPRVSTGATAAWQPGDGAAVTGDSALALGAATLVPRTAISVVEVPLQLLRQGVGVEQWLRSHLLGQTGTLLDTAVLGGTGGAQPLGIVNTGGIGTQAGGTLAHAGLLAMKRACITAGARADRLTWIGTPTVAETLGGRERVANGGRHLWDDGTVLGRPAFEAPTCPASTLIVGDFSTAILGMWGAGVRFDVDPSGGANAGFNRAAVAVRVVLEVDCCFPQPAAFTVATGVS